MIHSSEDLITLGRERWAGACFAFDADNIPALEEAAAAWRSAGQHFYAGYAMERAASLATGDDARMASFANAAILDLRAAVGTELPGPPPNLAALWKMATVLDQYYIGDSVARQNIRDLHAELAQRLLTYFAESPNRDAYLVRGVFFETDLWGHWDTIFPDRGDSAGRESSGPNSVSIGIPSAFQLFMALGDYAGGQQVIELCPDSFASPGLRGWRHVTEACLKPEQAPELFEEASDAFAQDTPPSPDELLKMGSWSSINIDLWVKYFRARSALARAAREPSRVKDLIAEAAESLRDIESGYLDQRAARLGVFVRVLRSLIADDASVDVDSARKQLSIACAVFGREPEDEMQLQFAHLAKEALEEFKLNPANAITSGRLSRALDLLRRLPLIDSHFTSAIIPAIGERMMDVIHGPIRTWIHRTLESITDERQLQRIILRLTQASVPSYAQIRHGPIEYGKDVVVLMNVEGNNVLCMYQVKCGDITVANWRVIRGELEDMFLVPLSSLQIDSIPDTREGILVAKWTRQHIC